MNNIAYYIYGITKNGSFDTNIPGIDRREKVYTISHNGISAITSCVSLDEFDEVNLKKNLESMDWLKDKVLMHEKVIEDIMRKTTIIPMKFCTIFKSEERILELLKEKYNYFTELLKEYLNKYEYGVKVYCAKKLKVETAVLSSGKEYLMAKKDEEQKSLEDEQRLNAFSEDIFRKLKPIAENIRINRLTTKELLSDKNKEQILNTSLLVSNNTIKELNDLVSDLVKTYMSEGITVELVGPLPIYSFVGRDNNEFYR